MGEPAARLTDSHSCPMVDPGPKPHVGLPVMLHGCATVLIGGENAARVGDMCACDGPPDPIAKGSTGVFIGGQPAARRDDETGHGGKITDGCPTVLIGDTASGNEAGSPLFDLDISDDEPPDDDELPGNPLAVLTASQAHKDESSGRLVGHVSAGHGATPARRPLPPLLAQIAAGTGHIRIVGTPAFRRQTLRILVRLNHAPAGHNLLGGIEAAGRQVTIRQSGTTNDENATNFSDGLFDNATRRPGPGSDSVVNFNPNRVRIGSAAWQQRDPAIGLGHELIHAYHDARGTSDGNISHYTDPAGLVRSAPGYEQQAVGLGAYNHNPITENVLRSQFNRGHLSIFGRELQRPNY